MGPVSDVGRSMMASLQQAMSQGMPVDQAVAYVKGMAQQGVAPLVDLYAMMNQFKRLQQPQPQPAPQGTVKDQIAQQAQQAEQQQMMQQGLGGLPAPVMDEAQYAGGGIVAFAEGDLVGGIPKFKDPTDYLNFTAQRIPGLGVSENEFIQKQMEEGEARRKKYGLGKYSELYKTTEAQIGKMEQESAQEAKRMKGLDRAEFFFNIAAEAAKPGGTLMQSIAQAGAGYSRQSKETTQRLRLLQKDAQQARMKLLEAEELRREGDISTASKLYDAGVKDSIRVGKEVMEEQTRRQEVAQRNKPDAMEQVRLQILNTPETLPDGKPNPKYDALQEKLSAMSPSRKMPTQYSAQLRSAESALKAAKAAAVDLAGKPIPNDPRVLEAQNYLEAVRRDIISSGYDLPGVSLGAGSAAPVATGPKIGDIEDGFRYKGGPPNNPSSWEPVK